jgi:hypothetical protein
MAVQQMISARQARELTKADERVDALETVEKTLASRTEFTSAIEQAWAGATRRYILIGRYLVQAKVALPHGEYEAMLESDLPFNRSTAFKLRKVTEALDAGGIADKELPLNYTLLYEVSTLTKRELAEARARKLIRQDVTRREISEFKAEMRVPRLPAPNRDRAALVRKRDTLREKIAALQEQLRAIEEELGGDVIDVEAVEVAGAG